MRITMAGRARLGPQRAVRAFRNRRGFVGVAGLALDDLNLGRMRVILDRRMAIGAAQQAAVNAGRVLDRIHRDAFAIRARHSRLPVASQARFILLQRLGRTGLRFSPRSHCGGRAIRWLTQ